MKGKVSLASWRYAGDKVRLFYEDGSIVFVSKEDFDRAFGAIISASKEDVINDFAIEG